MAIDGRQFIIFDLCLARALSILNGIWISKDYRIPLTAFAHKCLAEELLTYNLTAEAVLFGGVYGAIKHEMEGSPVPRLRSKTPALFTTIQEVYVLAHEVAHCVLQIDDALRQSKLSKNIAFIRTRESPAGMLRMLASLSGVDAGQPEFRWEQWKHIVGLAASTLSPQIQKESKLTIDTAGDAIDLIESSHAEFADLAIPKADLATLAIEMACDDIASAIAITSAVRELSVEPLQAARAIVACQYHLRWLAAWKSLAKGYAEGHLDEGADRSFRESALRTRKAYANTYIVLHNGPKLQRTITDTLEPDKYWSFEPVAVKHIFDAAGERNDKTYSVIVAMLRDRLKAIGMVKPESLADVLMQQERDAGIEAGNLAELASSLIEQ